MEAINGIEIKRQDLVEQDGKYILFAQIEELVKKNNQSLKVKLTDQLFNQYDSLIITKEDEIVAMKDQQLQTLDKVLGVFKTAQALFNE